MANFSLKRDPYESTYDDFMEVWLQFGHVFLFTAVFRVPGKMEGGKKGVGDIRHLGFGFGGP